jgi:WD40 repeat protein
VLPDPDPRVRQVATLLPDVIVRAMAVSPLGFVVAVADDDARVHVVEVGLDDDDEAEVLRILTPAERPRGDNDVKVCVAAYEDRVAMAAERTCEVWDARTGEQLASLQHPAEVRAMAIGENGTLVVTCDVKGRLALWDVASGARRELEAVRGRVTNLAVGLGDLLIAGTSEASGVAWLWDATTGKVTMSLAHQERDLPREVGWAVAFSPLGEYVLTAFGEGTVCAWSILENQLAVRLRHRRPGEHLLGGFIPSVAMDEDETVILTGHSQGAWLWDATTGELRGCLSRDFTRSVGFTHAGDILLASRGDHGVRVIRWTDPAQEARDAGTE